MKRQTMIILGLYLISWVGTLVSYFYLPDQIPLHYDLNFEPNGYGRKEWILLIGAVPILTYLLGKAFLRLDPNAHRLKKHERSYNLIMSWIAVLFMGVSWTTIYLSFCEKAGSPSRLRIYPLIFGLVLIIMGNLLPTIQHNYFLGIRTPWTLAGEISWKKTHRIGGYLFVFCGLLLCVGGLTGWKVLFGGAFAVVFGGIAVLYIYSYLIYRRYDQKDVPPDSAGEPVRTLSDKQEERGKGSEENKESL